ncbi:hypothetical protein Tco_1314248 [Tanacetum coccineum]
MPSWQSLSIPKALRWLRLSPKKLKRNQRLGFALDSPHTTSTLGFISPKKHKMQVQYFGYNRATSVEGSSLDSPPFFVNLTVGSRGMVDAIVTMGGLSGFLKDWMIQQKFVGLAVVDVYGLENECACTK